MCYQAAKNGVIVSTKPIPNTFEDCSEGDKVLITTRDVSLCFSLDHISSLLSTQLYPLQPLNKSDK